MPGHSLKPTFLHVSLEWLEITPPTEASHGDVHRALVGCRRSLWFVSWVCVRSSMLADRTEVVQGMTCKAI